MRQQVPTGPSSHRTRLSQALPTTLVPGRTRPTAWHRGQHRRPRYAGFKSLQQFDRSYLDRVAVDVTADVHPQMVRLVRSLQRRENLRIAGLVELQELLVRSHNAEAALLASYSALPSMRICIRRRLLRAGHV